MTPFPGVRSRRGKGLREERRGSLPMGGTSSQNLLDKKTYWNPKGGLGKELERKGLSTSSQDSLSMKDWPLSLPCWRVGDLKVVFDPASPGASSPETPAFFSNPWYTPTVSDGPESSFREDL